jgi:hypothetical protein
MAEQDLGEQLESLAAELNSAVQHYKSYATGTTDDLEYRRSVAEAATKVLVATKVPEEQWAEQSVWVSECHVDHGLECCHEFDTDGFSPRFLSKAS